MKKIICIVLLCIPLLAGGAKSKKIPGDSPPHQITEDAFFAMTRFIMSKEEIRIYRHLPDDKARAEFAKEFWDKRDPSPDLEENENQLEYEQRIEYANKWFKDRPDGRGWDTQRGHLLLQLGIPNERRTSVTTLEGTTWTVMVDEWYYSDYNLYLQFADTKGQGKYELQNWPDELLNALDQALMTLDLNNSTQNNFSFKVKFKKQSQLIEIRIPTKHIEFQEKNDQVSATFDIHLSVYRNFQKITTLKKEERVEKNKTDMLSAKYLFFTLPYTPPGKGAYYIEVIIKDRSNSFRSRNFCQFKI